MMRTLQNWIEIEGTGVGDQIIQSGASWLEIPGYSDVIFYLDVKNTVGQLHMNYETALPAEPSSWQPMVTAFSMAPGSTITPVFLSLNPTTPSCGLVRWRVDNANAGAWRASFRIHVVAKRRG